MSGGHGHDDHGKGDHGGGSKSTIDLGISGMIGSFFGIASGAAPMKDALHGGGGGGHGHGGHH
ncbi:MAG: hypothetical protein PHY14_04640 [Candidatus Gracilibacteria bacterium]|nr:hypothetical protein [Candidatus Gracilibacteria bacterium]